VLNQPGISAAIIGASRPEQVTENIAASGVELDANTLSQIDAVLGAVVQRDPALTQSPNPRP
jgi:aryl-alcohol dehydrogenase-like predicted oxidoreductase